MKKINIVSVLILSLFTTGNVLSQNVKWCGTTEMTQKLIEKNPHLLGGMLEARQKLEYHTQNFINNQKNKKNSVSTIYVIPVVFHILHDNGPENISDAQVIDAMRIINEDFRKFNADTVDVVQDFKSIIGDGDIEFRLAQKDPWGNPTNGINRIVSAETYIGDDGSKINQWPRSKYLNIWVVNTISSGAAGWTYLPGNVNLWPSGDGIIIIYNYIGNGYRTLTHEIGHWINLLHTWGPSNDAGNAGNCSGDDNVFDTPNTIGGFGCNLSRNTCSSLDNVQNFLDYGSCDRMFTEGQVTRIRAALTSSISQRNNLWTSSNLIATGTDNSAVVFFASTHVCASASVDFKDCSYNAITSWDWTFPGGTPSASNLKNPIVAYNTLGVYDVSLTVTNTSGSYATTKSSYITVMSSLSMPYSEGFESGMDWEIVNNDGGNTWEYTTDASYSGSGGSLKMNNYSGNTAGEFDVALSPSVDLSIMQSVQLTFKVAYAQKNSSDNDDVLKFYVSRDCGNTWSQRWGAVGASLAGTNGIQSALFTPTDTTQWQGITIANISILYLVENFRFKFEFKSDEGNNLYIDDININGVYKSIPILVLPPNYSTGQSFNITLDWNAVTGVDYYQYEVDTSILFSSMLLISGTNAYISSSNNGSDTEYQLANLQSETTYYWRVRTITGTDTSSWSSVWRFCTGCSVGTDKESNSNLNLLIFPNPVENYSVISFNLYKSQYVTLKVYDILGRKILNLIDEKLNMGTYRYETKGVKNSGIYFVRLIVGNQHITKRIIIK